MNNNKNNQQITFIKIKMSLTEACKQNYLFNHQSDIFNLKSMTRPEPFYSQKAHRANSTNRTSFNFMDWDDLKFA